MAQTPPLTSEWIEYIEGDSNIVISCPHGGYLEPSYMEERTCGTSTMDSFTQEVGRLMSDKLFAATGRRPHLIINLLHRRYLDANRDVDEAVCCCDHHPEQEEAYYAFQDSIRYSRDVINQQYSRGLYLDTHGQSHAEELVELGYLLVASELNQEDVDRFVNDTSIRTLGLISPYNDDFDDIVHGNVSFGGLLEARGYPSVPSPTYPGPGLFQYFSGGYNTEMWGSYLDKGAIDGIQIEAPYYCRESRGREDYTDALVDTILEFMRLHDMLE